MWWKKPDSFLSTKRGKAYKWQEFAQMVSLGQTKEGYEILLVTVENCTTVKAGAAPGLDSLRVAI